MSHITFLGKVRYFSNLGWVIRLFIDVMYSLLYAKTQNQNFMLGLCLLFFSDDQVFCFLSCKFVVFRSCINVKEICRLPLSEDPALAMAFSVARRAAAVPLLLVNGTYRKSVRSYLDSSIVQYQLQRMNDHGSLKG